MTFRRVMILLLIAVVVSAFVVPAMAAESDCIVILPKNYYPFEFNYTDGYSVCDLSNVPPIDTTLSVTLHVHDVTYTGHWIYNEEQDAWFFGDLDFGDPYLVGYQNGRMLIYLRGPHSSQPGVPLELYQCASPAPGAGSGSAAITDMLGYVIGWWSVIWGSFLYGHLSPLLSLLAVAVAIPLILVVIKLIHKFL